MTNETMNFGADVSRLLDIVAHALYSNRDVFLRELVSNAADACDRLRYESIRDPSLTSGDTTFKINVFKDTGYRCLHVQDNGIGMSRQEMIDNLGTIAKSGTRAMMEQIKSNPANDQDRLSLIGQFGVGFYASFMVAHKVEVISRRAGTAETHHWESDGRAGFTIREATADEAKKLSSGRGTLIILHVNDDASDFLIDEKLKQVIQIWSDHISVPVYLSDPAKTEIDEKPVNAGSALWMRSKQDITTEQYEEFYRHISHGLDEPVLTSHWRAEGKIEYTALLYIPTLRPWDMYDPGRKTSVRLYVKRVFISDTMDGLMYPWMRFVRGVIDSEDLPLNISREMLQMNPVIAKIRSGVAKRILSDLNKLSEDDPAAFKTFWGQFGPVLKEGLYDAVEHREGLFKIARFFSTHQEDTLTSLSDYVSRMKDGQDSIYYITGENLETLKNSPQIEGFKARGIEVLLMTDTIDDFWLQQIHDFDGKPFKSVTKGSIDLSKFEKQNKTDDKKPESEHRDTTPLLASLKDLLKDEVGDVRISSRLTDSPVCLVAAEGEVDMHMERVLKIHQKYDAQSKRILEVNEDHPLIQRLSTLAQNAGTNSPDLHDAAHLLLDQARIIQGEPIPDPANFARRMARFMERGLAA
ncbi:molecular chaperone HtpG [Micavibrio aeruginosavorus]|uniref:Chaperone protein HtpG n=1 Tax=Micavibrio aeruginosavorus (strain ARL-13) TaxID=856793 RepID=G2KQJ2_MICAA|nr:molecular chaperone HtpG [Micavibrio aeruginosavorus]AEP09128.1 histidine kinase-, DNA gyrase B-, and HSP90-like ATPase family protein [Micavibrio aeruginosavorus ARL-13]